MMINLYFLVDLLSHHLSFFQWMGFEQNIWKLGVLCCQILKNSVSYQGCFDCFPLKSACNLSGPFCYCHAYVFLSNKKNHKSGISHQLFFFIIICSALLVVFAQQTWLYFFYMRLLKLVTSFLLNTQFKIYIKIHFKTDKKFQIRISYTLSTELKNK